jgi:hypothetical protein
MRCRIARDVDVMDRGCSDPGGVSTPAIWISAKEREDNTDTIALPVPLKGVAIFAVGTNAKCCRALKLSAYRRRPEASGARSGPTRLVESRCGAVALGRTYLLPPLSSGGALVVQP